MSQVEVNHQNKGEKKDMLKIIARIHRSTTLWRIDVAFYIPELGEKKEIL